MPYHIVEEEYVSAEGWDETRHTWVFRHDDCEVEDEALAALEMAGYLLTEDMPFLRSEFSGFSNREKEDAYFDLYLRHLLDAEESLQDMLETRERYASVHAEMKEIYDAALKERNELRNENKKISDAFDKIKKNKEKKSNQNSENLKIIERLSEENSKMYYQRWLLSACLFLVILIQWLAP